MSSLARLARIVVPPYVRVRDGHVQRVEGYTYERKGGAIAALRSKVLALEATPDGHPEPTVSPAPPKEGEGAEPRRIVRVLEVTDTREWDEDLERPVPGSGQEHQCDRCGRCHEVWVRVRLDDGTESVIGTGCARTGEGDLVRKAASSAASVSRLEHRVEGLRKRWEVSKGIWKQVEELPLPPIEGPFEGSLGQEYRMGDARVFQRFEPPPITDERRRALISSWRQARWREAAAAAGEETVPWVLEGQVRQAEAALERARKRLKKALEGEEVA
jgi:hypothetical protein